MSGLDLAPDLGVPLEYTTEATAILGKRGSGKTSTARRAVEEMLNAGQQVVVVDTVGVWWGLRSPAAGQESGGYDVVIFGGEHGDVPLEEKSGKVIAGAVIENGLSAVIDTSLLSKAAARRFLLDFVTTVYHLKARERTPMHVVFDEADELAPQRPRPEGAPLLGAMEDFVRRGRSRGLGCTLVTQRPAVLNKDVLTQVEVLIAMQMTGPLDVAAIDEWTKMNADVQTALDVKRTLAGLTPGEGWVWSPSWLGVLQRVKFHRPRTFDSSATPKVGQKRAEPKTRRTIDLTVLGEQITATVEAAKAADPKTLRTALAAAEAKVAELEQKLLADRPAEIVREEVPVLTDADRFTAAEVAERILEASKVMAAAVPTIQQLAEHWASIGLTGPPPVPAPTTPQPRSVVVTPPKVDASATSMRDGKPLAKAERSILTVLAQRGAQSDRQIATLAGYSSKGGGFRNALGSLRTAGHIVGTREHIEATASGIAALGNYEPLPQGRDLVAFWLTHSQLGKAERLILSSLIEQFPDPTTQEEVARMTGYEPGGGGFRNAIGKLRSLELIHGTRDGLWANDELGEAGK